MMLSHVTLKALEKRNISSANLSFILGVTQQAVDDILNGVQIPTAQQLAIIKLLACVRNRDLERVMREKDDDYEWRAIVGFDKYEVSIHGQVRRAVYTKGSLPGNVLKQSKAPDGRFKVTLYDSEGRMKTRQIHKLVCRAFHGERPSPHHMACHRNDDIAINTKDNLYWGTALDNARDRIANEDQKLIDSGFKINGNGTKLAQSVKLALIAGEISQTKARLIIRKSMRYSLDKMNA